MQPGNGYLDDTISMYFRKRSNQESLDRIQMMDRDLLVTETDKGTILPVQLQYSDIGISS
jgi:hypothetical protein